MLSPTHLLDAHTPLSPTSGLKRLPSYGSMQEVSRVGARADGLDLTAHGHPESLSPAQRGLNSSSAMRSRQGKSTSNHDATARNGHATEESHDMDRKRSPGWHTFGVHLLENKGSVARDHLAAERTYLAWLRTSLALASIGIGDFTLFRVGIIFRRVTDGYVSGLAAITQLFRLPSSTTITSPSSSLVQAALQSRSILSTAQQEQLLDQLASSTLGDSELTGLLVTLLRDQAERLDTLSQQVNDPLKYRHLGKPIVSKVSGT